MSLPTFLSGVTGYYVRIGDDALLAIRPTSCDSAVMYVASNSGEFLTFPKGIKIDGVVLDTNDVVTLDMSKSYRITYKIYLITEDKYKLAEYFTLPYTREEKLEYYTLLVKGSANKDDTTIRLTGSMDGVTVGRVVTSDLLEDESTIINVDYDKNTITLDNPVIYTGSNITLFVGRLAESCY